MRLKIIAGNLALVVLLGLAAYAFVGGQLRADLLGRLEGRIANDRELFERSFRLSALEFVDLVSARAGERQIRDVFGGLDVDSRRTRAYEAAESTAAWLADPARGQRGAPDVAVIVDESGKVLARNGGRNLMFGTALAPQLPALGLTLRDGSPRHDVWLEPQENRVLQAAIAAIRSDGNTVIGALVVGYDLSNGVARREKQMLERDIAFLVDGKVYSSSLEGGARDLRAFLFGPAAPTTNGVLGGQMRVSPQWRATLAGEDFTGVTARLPLTPAHPVAYAVLGNRTQQLAMVDVVDVILVLTLLGAILVILYGFVIGSTIMRPIEEIEEGVLAVINGRTDLRFEVKSAELGGLAFRINQLLNVFTGTEEQAEDDQGRVSVPPSEDGWKDAAFADAPGPGAQAAPKAAVNPDEPLDDPALASQLAGEDTAAYERRVYQEYVSAKQALGENVSNIPQDRFHQRLVGRADALTKKHGCRMVRFQVETRSDQVVLRPVLIR